MSWVEVDGPGWKWVQGLVIPIKISEILLLCIAPEIL